MSVATIITLGYGSFGGPSFVVTLGYGDLVPATSTVDTHDGFDVTDLDIRKRREREERDKYLKSEREKLREFLEAAFNPPVEHEAREPAEIRKETREVAASVVKRMESGRITIDWKALGRQHELENKIHALREAFISDYFMEQQRIEDEEDIFLLGIY